VSTEAAMHELLREAGGCAVSLLAAGQEWLAQHFARGVPPIAMWHGVATEREAEGAPLLVGAVGWLECEVARQVPVGTHTFFVCEVLKVESGVEAPALVRVRGGYQGT
jgi:flavin reductase